MLFNIYGGEVAYLTFQEIESGSIAHEQEGQHQQPTRLTKTCLPKLSQRKVT